MKKLTVLCLLIAFVAGFAFADGNTFVEGLQPYTKSGFGVKFEAPAKIDTAIVSERGMSFTGNYLLGVKNADASLDIYAKIATEYNIYKELEDKLTLSPEARASYKGEAFVLDLHYLGTLSKNYTDIFDLNFKNLDTGAKFYANFRQGFLTDNGLLALYLDGSIVDKKNISTNVSVGYFVPATTGKSISSYIGIDYLRNIFNATADLEKNLHKNFVLATYVDYNFSTGNSKDKAAGMHTVNLLLNYNDFLSSAAELSIDVFADVITKDNNTNRTANVYAKFTYDYSVITGTNAMDKFTFTAYAKPYGHTLIAEDSEFSSGVEGEIKVHVPYLIPVEMYDNVSLNLPSDLSVFADTHKIGNGDRVVSLTLDAKVYPVYAEIKNPLKFFGLNTNVVKASIHYENVTEWANGAKKGTEQGFDFGLEVLLDAQAGKVTDNSAKLSLTYTPSKEKFTKADSFTVSFTQTF